MYSSLKFWVAYLFMEENIKYLEFVITVKKVQLLIAVWLIDGQYFTHKL